MTTNNAAKLRSYINDRQDEAVELDAILQGIDMLLEEERGGNAALALIGIAVVKAHNLQKALDSVNWPKAVADDVEPPKG